MEVCGQLHILAALTLGKEPPVHIAQETGWAPEPVWTLYAEKNLLPLPGIELRQLSR
jgi:hypothetical protein